MDPKLAPKLGRLFVGGPAAWDAYSLEVDPEKKRKALNRIVTDNEAFIKKCIRALLDRGLASPHASAIDISYDDMLQAGRLGYVKALESFDPNKGTLPNHAKSWIRNRVQRTAAKDATIHKPEQVRIPATALRRGEAAEARTGNTPTHEDMGITEKQLNDWRLHPTVVPIDRRPGGYHTEDTKHPADCADRVPTDDPNPEELTGLAELSALRDRLPPKEREVIRRLFWCDEDVIEIAHNLNISVDEVCDLRDSALQTLHDSVT